MKVHIINIGDELLLGQVVNTLSADIARMLAPLNIPVARVEVVGDGADDIENAVGRAMATDSEVILVTGGLGPTRDDITKKVMAKIFGGPMIEDAETLENVKKVVEARGLKLNELTRAQAMVPASCKVIQNRVGTAPINWFEKDGKVIVSMPGVPFETLTMLKEAVIPRLTVRFPACEKYAHRVLIVTGYTESALAMALADIEDLMPESIHLAYLPKPGIVRLRIDGTSTSEKQIQEEVDSWCRTIADRLGDAVKATEDLTDAEILLKVAGERQLTIATAESCTGGNIAHRITAIPGSSASFKGSVVAYSNDIKEKLLCVGHDTIMSNGVVSIPVVEQMALGACNALGTDVAIATSGIAGPTGAVPGKPVGTVCMAVAFNGRVVSATHHFPGQRERVIERATSTAIVMAIDMITDAHYSLHGYK